MCPISILQRSADVVQLRYSAPASAFLGYALIYLSQVSLLLRSDCAQGRQQYLGSYVVTQCLRVTGPWAVSRNYHLGSLRVEHAQRRQVPASGLRICGRYLLRRVRAAQYVESVLKRYQSSWTLLCPSRQERTRTVTAACFSSPLASCSASRQAPGVLQPRLTRNA